jgi:hypothetical protein
VTTTVERLHRVSRDVYVEGEFDGCTSRRRVGARIARLGAPHFAGDSPNAWNTFFDGRLGDDDDCKEFDVLRGTFDRHFVVSQTCFPAEGWRGQIEW